MKVWIVYDKCQEEVLGAYNTDIWDKDEVREDVIENSNITPFAFNLNCVIFLEEVL